MVRIDLKAGRRAAFARGFWRGLAAPIMIYAAASQLPEEAIPRVQDVPNPASKDGIRSDWKRVGAHIKDAVRAHASSDE